jgi:hypothetical protein
MQLKEHHSNITILNLLFFGEIGSIVLSTAAVATLLLCLCDGLVRMRGSM